MQLPVAFQLTLPLKNATPLFAMLHPASTQSSLTLKTRSSTEALLFQSLIFYFTQISEQRQVACKDLRTLLIPSTQLNKRFRKEFSAVFYWWKCFKSTLGLSPSTQCLFHTLNEDKAKRITIGLWSFLERDHLISSESILAGLEKEFWDFVVYQDRNMDVSASIFQATRAICEGKDQFFFDRWLAENKDCDDGIEFMHPSRTNNEALVDIVTELHQIPENIGTLSTITGLDFNCNLIECLPHTIGFLQQLTRLNLRDNQISEIPSSFGKLSNLQRLNLCENQITELPASFGDLKSLSRLNIAINKLASLPSSFCNLTNLEWLEMEQNELSSLPHDFGRLDKLFYLNCEKNHLSMLPDSIGNLVNLDQLFVDSNLLVTLPDSLENLQRLSTLDVSVNALEILPSALSRNISSLNLSANPKLPSFLSRVEFLGQMSNLTILMLSGVQLAILPQALFSLPSLHYLDLSKNALSALDVRICSLHRLQTLILNHNCISSLPNEIGECAELRHFYIDNNQLTTIPSVLFELASLTQVSIQHNQLRSLPDLGDCIISSPCEKLMIGWNALPGLPSSFSKLANLSELVATNNRLLMLPDSIKDMHSLRKMHLSSNQLTRLPAILPQNLTLLDLSKNKLRSFPALSQQNALAYLQKLDLGDNVISHLPADFGTFLSSSLIFLNLSGNRLESLPDSCCLLDKRLEILSVQGNPLTQMPPNVADFVDRLLAYSDDDSSSIGSA